MNRREFIRSAIATTTVLAVGITGMFEIASKAAGGQGNPQQQALLPQVTSGSNQSSTISSGASSFQSTSQSLA